MTTWVAAVDFGATSIRVCRVGLGDHPPLLEVVHRHPHAPVRDPAGRLRWDWSRLVAEMEKGLVEAIAPGDVASIGVDTWGVDYGLLDEDGHLVADPVSYRDERTDGYRRVLDELGEDNLFERTGVQPLGFNTIFQLAAHDPAELNRAQHLLLLPELLVHHLTGTATAERTSAGTTGLVDIRSGRWDLELADAVTADRSLFAAIADPGTAVGSWHDVPVHLVGGHDTASAVAAMGSAGGPTTAFVSAGTWFLVGREQAAPDLSPEARAAGLSNEIGVAGDIRLLKNLSGAWLVDGCRAAWGEVALGDLLAQAALLPTGPTVDVADPRFLHPDDLHAEVLAAAGLPPSAAPAEVLRCLVDSLAEGITSTLDDLGGITEVRMFGGAARWAPLRDRLAERSGCAVHQGPAEATAIGNALVQGIGLGLHDDLADARRHLTEEQP